MKSLFSTFLQRSMIHRAAGTRTSCECTRGKKTPCTALPARENGETGMNLNLMIRIIIRRCGFVTSKQARWYVILFEELLTCAHLLTRLIDPFIFIATLHQEGRQGSRQGGRQAIFSARSSRRREEDAEHQKQLAQQANQEKRETILHAIRAKNRASAVAARNQVDATGRPLPPTVAEDAAKPAGASGGGAHGGAGAPSTRIAAEGQGVKDAGGKGEIRRENPNKFVEEACR